MTMEEKLAQFQSKEKITTRSRLAIVLFVTRVIREKGWQGSLEIIPNNRYVKGLNEESVQAILTEYDVKTLLEPGGGRLNRAAARYAQTYIDFLAELRHDEAYTIELVEAWWVERIKCILHIAQSTVFLSYCWQDDQQADFIDDHLRQRGFPVKRDKRDIEAWGSIRTFMESIRQQDYAILIISDAYLKSENCMFEVLEIMKEPEYKNRIFPVVTTSEIYSPAGRILYVAYWEAQSRDLKEHLCRISPENGDKSYKVLKRRKDIAANMDAFLDLLADMSNPRPEDAVSAIEKRLRVS